MIDLEKIVAASYSPHPKVEQLRYIYDIKSWLHVHIRELKNHTEPHAYRFKLSEDKVLVSYKRFAMDPEWKSLPEILCSLPETNPGIVRPTWDRQCSTEDLGKKLKTLKTTFHVSESEWWDKFVEDLKKNQR